jgi:hypothetical protein
VPDPGRRGPNDAGSRRAIVTIETGAFIQALAKAIGAGAQPSITQSLELGLERIDRLNRLPEFTGAPATSAGSSSSCAPPPRFC